MIPYADTQPYQGQALLMVLVLRHESPRGLKRCHPSLLPQISGIPRVGQVASSAILAP